MKRHPRNPILTRKDIPAVSPRVTDVSSVFNPGAIRHGERYRLVLRVQTRGRETVALIADSDDGIRFDVRPRLIEIEGLAELDLQVFHAYDFRLTRIDDVVLAVFALDTDHGCRTAVARMTEHDNFKLVGIDREHDVRNGVLFPEKFDGRYLRLERPNDTDVGNGVLGGTTIRLAESEDLVRWTPLSPVMSGRPHYWDELIGSGPPPVKTRQGWLHVYHGIATHFASSNIYQAGVSLLDLADPSRVLARGRNNILEPREPYETTGQVPNVIFPSGMIVEEHDSEGFATEESAVKIYYGAADSCVGLAETTVSRLLSDCRVE